MLVAIQYPTTCPPWYGTHFKHKSSESFKFQHYNIKEKIQGQISLNVTYASYTAQGTLHKKKVYDEIPKQIGALMQKLRDTQVLTTNGTLSKTQLPYMP